MAQRVFVLLKRKPGLTFEQFKEHYESSHAKLGEKYFGHLFETYKRNYLEPSETFEAGVKEAAYDCLTELVFREPGGYAELKRIASDPAIHKILAEDEARFLDRTVSGNAVCNLVESDLTAFHKANA